MRPFHLNKHILLLVLLATGGGSLFSTNYYVNDNALAQDQFCTAVGNNANPGTTAAPFANLKFVIDNRVLTAGDTVFVDTGTYPDELIDVGPADAGVVIRGADKDLTFFDGVNKTNRFMVISGNNVELHDLTISRYGHDPGLYGQGVTVENATNVLLENLNFFDMGNSGGEAPLYITTTSTLDVSATVNACIFRDNLGNFGGGIDVCANTLSAIPSLTVTINDCVVENSGKLVFNGGALLVYKGLSAVGATQPPTVTVNNSVFGTFTLGNQAMRGGAIYVDDGSLLNLNGVCVSNNQAIDVAGPDGGGGIYIFDGTINMTDCHVANNTAVPGTNKYGGGLYINKTFSGASILNATRTVFSGNLGLDGVDCTSTGPMSIYATA